MLGGPGRTPTTRGSSRAAELLDAGVSVAAGLDNMYDIWFRFGRMDPAEVALLTCLSAGLRTDEEVRIGFEMTNVRAADVLGRPRQSMEVGAPADFVILNGSTIVEFMRNLPGRRTLFRGGREVAGIHGSAWALEDAGPRPPPPPG
jgi:cytosine deaminase